MTTYKVYRNLSAPLTARIRAAVSYFHRTRRALPASIAVHPVEVNAARGAVGALALGVPVEGNGGCLWGEVWLGEVDGGN